QIHLLCHRLQLLMNYFVVLVMLLLLFSLMISLIYQSMLSVHIFRKPRKHIFSMNTILMKLIN
ncbi:hypothetical protein WUBG_18562, partial [Wuchereria bancrofti]